MTKTSGVAHLYAQDGYLVGRSKIDDESKNDGRKNTSSGG